MENRNKKQIVVAVSGGFDPLHVGHIRMMQEAKKLGHKLVVILNNDNWVQTKKGCVFMNQKERKELIESIGCVDEVVLTSHAKGTKDMSVCGTLKKVKPDIFANGGDRKFDNIPEVPVCKKLGCKMVFNLGKGGKVQSSSWLLTDYLKKKNGK